MDSHLKKPSTNSVGNWTPHEDEIILRYVYDKGKSDEHMMWGNLSETLNGRSGKSCRERWFNHLDPKIKRTEWSQEEQWVLFILRNQSSEKWSLISKRLMGRTDNAVKNYWNSRLKKRIDSMQHAVNQHFERKRKQKIASMTQSQNTDQQANSDHQNKAATSTIPTSEQVQNLSPDQKLELEAYMERIKAEYLQKILEQVNNQNVEYFENLACEYTLQYQQLMQKQSSPGDASLAAELEAVMFAKQCSTPPMENDDQIHEKKPSLSPYDAPKINGSQTKDESSPRAAQSTARQGNNDTQACGFDGDEGMLDEERENPTQLPFFMKNPEVIKMHLDILYKSITFLSEQKITAKIEQYKQAKEQKKREEEERLQMQMQIKKQRGRAANNQQQQNNYPQQANRKDRKAMASGERDQQSYNNNRAQQEGEFSKPGQLARQGYNSNCGNQNNKDTYSSERYEQAKSKNNTNDNKQGREGQSPYKSSHYYDQKAEKDGAVRSSSYGNMNDGSKKCSGQTHECNCGYNNKKQSCHNQQSNCHNQSKLQKDGQIIAHRLCNSKSQNQAISGNQNLQQANDGMHDNEDSFWSQSSCSNCSQLSKSDNKERVQADGSGKSKDSHRLSPKSLIVKRMLKKLKKQKRQYKLMDKIFFSEKAERLSNIVDPYLKRAISPERMQYDNFFTQQAGLRTGATNTLTEQAFKTEQELVLNANLTKNIEESTELAPEDLCPKTLKANPKSDMASTDNKKKIVPGTLGIKKTIQKQNKAMISLANNRKMKDLSNKKIKNNNGKNGTQTDIKGNGLQNESPMTQQEPVLSTQPVSAIYPFDIGVAPVNGQVHSSQPQMIPNQGYMGAPPPAFEMAGDLFNGIPNTNSNGAAQTSSLFGNSYNGYQSQIPPNNMLPFGIPSHMGSNQVPPYQSTGNGNTFFHQGCNIQYTDVKTFTTTIHLHCGGSADGKQPHQDFCPEAKNGTGCKQTMHFTSMLPSQQYIQHPNVGNSATQSFQQGPVPMMFAPAQKPNSYPAASSLANEYSQSQNNNEMDQQMGQYQRTKDVQNEFVIDEHQIGQPKSQMNNQSSSYHGSSKTNARSHSKRFGMRSKRSMMPRASGNKNTYKTQNFLNQTMTQINKGKDRELNPLYNRRSAALSSTLANNKFSNQPQYNFNFNQVAQSINNQQPEMMNMQMVAEGPKGLQGVEQERGVGCGNTQQQSLEKQTQQSTPMTSKSNPNMFQSPAPTHSFARVAFNGLTPSAASAFMSANDLAKQVYPQSALRPGIQGSASANQFGHSNFFNTESKKMGHQQMNPLTMTGRASVSTAATSMNPASTPNFSSGVKNMGGQMMPAHMIDGMLDSHMNQNEFSSDILMKVKSGNHMQHQQNCQLDYSQARLVNSNSGQMAATVAASVPQQNGVYAQQKQQAVPQSQVPIVSAFQY